MYSYIGYLLALMRDQGRPLRRQSNYLKIACFLLFHVRLPVDEDCIEAPGSVGLDVDTALLAAASGQWLSQPNIPYANLLLAAGADINRRFHMDGRTLGHFFCVEALEHEVAAKSRAQLHHGRSKPVPAGSSDRSRDGACSRLQWYMRNGGHHDRPAFGTRTLADYLNALRKQGVAVFAAGDDGEPCPCGSAVLSSRCCRLKVQRLWTAEDVVRRRREIASREGGDEGPLEEMVATTLLADEDWDDGEFYGRAGPGRGRLGADERTRRKAKKAKKQKAKAKKAKAKRRKKAE